MRFRATREQIICVIALIVVAALAVFTHADDKAAFDTYLSTDYASGGMRGWAALLEREGIHTQRFVLRPIELNESTDTLITIAPLAFSQAVSPRTDSDIGALAAWVRRGGRLVYIGRYPGRERSERLQLELPRALPNVGAAGRMQGPLIASTGALQSVGTDRMIALPPARVDEEAFDRNGDIVTRYPLGKGEVVAVSDAVPFANRALGLGGNARLAYLLGIPRKAGGTVAFDDGVHGEIVNRPWYRALNASELLALAIIGIAVLLALAGAMLPTIPRFALHAKREPTSAEFIAALAALYERTGARTEARATLAADALAAVARSIGMSERSSPAAIAARAAPRPGGANVTRLADALNVPPANDADLVASAKLVHTIRKDFIYYGSHGDGRRAAFTGRSRTRRRR